MWFYPSKTFDTISFKFHKIQMNKLQPHGDFDSGQGARVVHIVPVTLCESRGETC